MTFTKNPAFSSKKLKEKKPAIKYKYGDEELTVKKIAEKTGIPESIIRRRYQQGKRDLELGYPVRLRRK